jgi:hypothetical protein
MPHWTPHSSPLPSGEKEGVKKLGPLGRAGISSKTNAVILKAKGTTLSKRQRLFKFSIVRCQREKVPL